MIFDGWSWIWLDRESQIRFLFRRKDFFYAFATCSELPSNTRTMNKPCSAMPVFVFLISFWNCNFAILLNFLPSRAARHPAVQKTICLKIPFNMRNIHGESVLSPSVLYPEYFCPLMTCHKAFTRGFLPTELKKLRSLNQPNSTCTPK